MKNKKNSKRNGHNVIIDKSLNDKYNDPNLFKAKREKMDKILAKTDLSAIL